MFRGLINDAKSAAGSVVAKYAARASVAVPFVIAFGFATAGITLLLVERFGHRNAYLMVAGSFMVLGFMAALIVRAKEHEDVVADAQAGKADTADVSTDTAAAAAVQTPLALLGLLFSSPVGPASLMSLVRAVGRNLPLAAMLVGIGVLFWPKSADQAGDGVLPEAPRPIGAYRPGASQHAA